jgi:hypothetical protein
MKMKINSNSQLELSIQNPAPCRSLTRGQRRRQTATLWFSRMRQVVERATGWNPAPPPRPEQIFLLNAPNSR